MEKKKTKQSKFFIQLQEEATKKIVLLVMIGGIFFCIAMLLINWWSLEYNRRKHLEAIERSFRSVYRISSSYLLDNQNQDLFLDYIKGEKREDDLRYSLNKFNSEKEMQCNMIVTDRKGTIVFHSFSNDSFNLHRQAFNEIVCDNSLKEKKEIYNAVYYFAKDSSEYVLVKTLQEGDEIIGFVTLYFEGEYLRQMLSDFQYDTIITNFNHDVIYCSNRKFLEERSTNKYRFDRRGQLITRNQSRYMATRKIDKEREIIIYSFIYYRRNFIYASVGVVTIAVLGLIWYLFFGQMSRSMAAKTVASVEALVEEMRIVRDGDSEHIIAISTGDEFEEIANQMNQMVRSINDLNYKNTELLQLNNLMEMQNLQAQLNPHFIYNTLDNIKYLIATNPTKAAIMIERFTRILRYSINNTKQKVSIKEDVKYIEDYLDIQKMRFTSRFEYNVEIEQECTQYEIPKLLLQPIIENSIKYGFKKKTEIEVAIKIYKDSQFLCLSVWDSGAGVPKATLETLRGIIISDQMNTSHNGLQNIAKQIRLIYGKGSTMCVDSIEGEEFKVMIRLWIGESNV